MDKIALIADIHGNLSALEAVLSDIKQRGITHIYCLGDIAIKGVHPNEVTELIKQNEDQVIKGNMEDISIKNNEITNETLKSEENYLNSNDDEGTQ